jgi:uncharacterized protein YdaU (DUF1376 family)
MTAKKPPKHDTWMPLYVADYLSATQHLDAELHGAYLLLIMAAWKADGKLPNDPRALRQITRMTAGKWARAKRVLAPFFIVTEHFWMHKRVRLELDKAKAYVENKSKAGRAGAASRWWHDMDRVPSD